MNYDTLSPGRKEFIDNLENWDGFVRTRISDLFVDAVDWQGFRVSVFDFVDSYKQSLMMFTDELVRT